MGHTELGPRQEETMKYGTELFEAFLYILNLMAVCGIFFVFWCLHNNKFTVRFIL